MEMTMTNATDTRMLSRRKALARIGLAAGAVYVAPVMMGANAARASGNSGGNSGNSGNSGPSGNSGNSGPSGNSGNSGNSWGGSGNSGGSWGNHGHGSAQNSADVVIALQRLLGL
jgi:uncharacterized membrane protein